MLCCRNCFIDTEIIAIIEGTKTIGNCDFCESKNISVYDIDKNNYITELFDGLLDIYTPASALPLEFPKERTNLIKNILRDEWSLFGVDHGAIYRILTSLCSARYREQPELFDGPVGILQSIDNNYLNDNAVLRNFCWSDFSKAIKTENRFHGDHINTDILFKYLHYARKIYTAGKIFFRSRICPTKDGYSSAEMGAPPNGKAKAGRVNPEGISTLYLADAEDTTIHEIRAGLYDFVTIGSFALQKDIEVIDLANIDKISPFLGAGNGFDFLQYAININHLKMIGQEIARPIRNDNALDYLPTQYISDYIKSKKYDGIEYISTMREKGVNLAVFDPSCFLCTGTVVYDIKSIAYRYDRVRDMLP